MASSNALLGHAAGPSESLNPEQKPLIPYKSNIPQLREVYERNKSSFLHRLAPETRNAIMELAVTLDSPVKPVPVTNGGMSVNKFVWGEFESRAGTINGRDVTIRFPTGPLAVVSLRLTCRQFYHELDGVFYRENTFLFNSTDLCKRYLSSITIERRRQICNVELAVEDNPIETVALKSMFVNHLYLPLEMISKFLVAHCPLLNRLILNKNLHRSKCPHMRHDQDAPESYRRELGDLLWRQGDRNPARVFEAMSSCMWELAFIVQHSEIIHFPISLPQFEVFIHGSPTVSARVSSRRAHRPKSDVPSYMTKFEHNLSNANKEMKILHQNWPKTVPPTEKFDLDALYDRDELDNPIDYFIPESSRMQDGPNPDLAHFQPYDLNGGHMPKNSGSSNLPATLQMPPKYDENGLLLWKCNERSCFLEIVWRGEEILCGVDFDEQSSPGGYSFELVSRFANWDGLGRLVAHFGHMFHHLGHSQHMTVEECFHMFEDAVLMFTEHPTPRDIDAALRATGLLNFDETPAPQCLINWIGLVNSTESIAARLGHDLEVLRPESKSP
ncbi:hypothetical protein E0Z10_g636 [Xylaria hypoxylon]|uniref:DUF7730 domain-containing protein n=1 Tax=Xylaria hypoxylon TaxID=37992 RepID=A0A4Z0ZGR2_9PEZI|nr:hypothetical protein E0Z10_g636 [Xylaria hypoxylon]